jgi:glycosyltransferase involved in cell wall biosynthesis
MRSKYVRLFRKALAILFKKGPVFFTKTVLRALYARRYILTFLFGTVLPMMIKTLFQKGPQGCVQYSSLLFKKLKYHRAYKQKEAEYAGSEVNLALVRPNSANTRPEDEDILHFSVLFVTSIDVQPSKRYRVDNVCEQLNKRGIKTSTLYEVDIFERFGEALTFDVIVFQRLPIDPGVRYLLEEACARGIALVFEIDDYVFDASVYLAQDSVKNASPTYRRYMEAHCNHLYQTMMACQYFISTTRTLAEAARRKERISYVIRNGLNDRQVALADQAQRRRAQRRRDAWVRIGYQPGTSTHRLDFAIVLPALCRILDEFPQVKLVVQGHLDLPEVLQPYHRRIERWPYVPWQKLVDVTGRLDIAIAPLEPDNLLNEAKSALKYFEPGLVEVPVVASPTEDFRTAIRHGVNGFLAATDEEWYESLCSLVSDPVLRQQVAQAARQDVLTHYTSEAQSTDTLAVFQDILRDHRSLAGARRMVRQPTYFTFSPR